MTPTEAILLFLAGRGGDAVPQVERIRRAAADPASDPEAAEHLAAFRQKAASLLTLPKVVAATGKYQEKSQAAFHAAVANLSPEAAALLPLPPADPKRADPYFARLVEYLAERYSEQPPPDRSAAESLASSVFSSYLSGGRSAPHLDDPQDPWGLLLEITTRKLTAGADAVRERWRVGGGPDEFVRAFQPAYAAECRALLTATPDEHRAVVAGRLNGRSIDQLVQLTGKSEPFVKAALKAAHNLLRRSYAAAS